MATCQHETKGEPCGLPAPFLCVIPTGYQAGVGFVGKHEEHRCLAHRARVWVEKRGSNEQP